MSPQISPSDIAPGSALQNILSSYRLIAVGNGDAELFADFRVVFFDGRIVVRDRDIPDILAPEQNACGDLRRADAEIVIADGERCDAAARTEIGHDVAALCARETGQQYAVRSKAVQAAVLYYLFVAEELFKHFAGLEFNVHDSLPAAAGGAKTRAAARLMRAVSCAQSQRKGGGNFLRRLCLFNKCLFGLDRTGGAYTFASAAVDAGIGIYNVLIGALGNEITGVEPEIYKEVKAKLGLDENRIISTIITLGYETEQSETNKIRKDFDTVVSLEKLGDKF